MKQNALQRNAQGQTLSLIHVGSIISFLSELPASKGLQLKLSLFPSGDFYLSYVNQLLHRLPVNLAGIWTLSGVGKTNKVWKHIGLDR